MQRQLSLKSKRKREANDAETNEERKLSKPSKKTIRSPKLNEGRKQDMDKLTEAIDRLNKTIDGMSQEIKVLKKEVQGIRKEDEELKQEVKKLRTDLQQREDTWRKEKEEIREENRKMKKALAEVEQRLEKQERKERRNNIIIGGLEMEECLNIEDAVKIILNEKLQSEAKIKNCFAIGREKREILVQLESWEDKKNIFQNISKLKGTPIYIYNDKTVKEREVQRKIKVIAEEKKQNGRKVKIGYQKLTVDGAVFKWNEFEQKLEKAITGDSKN